MPFRRFSVPVLLALTLVGAACSSKAASTSAGGTSTTAAATGSSTTVAAAGSGTPNPSWPKTIRFSVVPAEQSADLSSQYKPLVDVVKKKLGVSVEITKAVDYNGVIEGMIANKVDLAEFGPFSYVLAKTNGADITPIGAQTTAKGVTPGYQSYGIVKATSPITSLDGYKGKKVCFVDPGSTSGFLYPSAALLKLNIDPQKDVTPVFAGGHDTSVKSVADGTCDAGFAFDTMVDKTSVDKGLIKSGDLKVIWKSDTIPGSPLAVNNKTLPADLVKALSDLVLNDFNKDGLVTDQVCASADKCQVASDTSQWGYVKVDDTFYNPIRAVCDVTKAAKCQKG